MYNNTSKSPSSLSKLPLLPRFQTAEWNEESICHHSDSVFFLLAGLLILTPRLGFWHRADDTQVRCLAHKETHSARTERLTNGQTRSARERLLTMQRSGLNERKDNTLSEINLSPKYESVYDRKTRHWFKRTEVNIADVVNIMYIEASTPWLMTCLLYTSDAADES